MSGDRRSLKHLVEELTIQEGHEEAAQASYGLLYNAFETAEHIWNKKGDEHVLQCYKQLLREYLDT